MLFLCNLKHLKCMPIESDNKTLKLDFSIK